MVGAGFGGLAAARALRAAGVQVLVLERGERLGGVWRDNTYPGAACDVPSSLYSYSFAPEPAWPRRYAAQPDILAYLERVAAQEGLTGLVRTSTEVTAARWQEAGLASRPGGRWRVEALGPDGPQTHHVDLLVAAVGQLSRPHEPDLPGRDAFAGPVFHTAAWDHGVDLTGARVAVLGTGASAVQLVPRVAEVAGHVTVFQRSAPYVVPKPDRAYRRRHHRLFRALPAAQRLGREATRVTGEQLNRALTEQTRLTRLLSLAFALHLRRQVRDPALRARLRPDYPIGCKRLLFSNDWYPALTRPHVEVVTERVTALTTHGLRTADSAEHPADVLVLGTGFRATEFLAPMRITGRGGRDLHEEWAGGAHAYLGMSVPGFPNLGIVYGPHTNLGGSSIVAMIESQAGYLAQAAHALRSGRLPVLEVRADVAAAYDREMEERLARTVWAAGCTSWYADGDRISTNWPGLVAEYAARTATFEPADYCATYCATTGP